MSHISTLRPLLKWAGGKRWFINRYKNILALATQRGRIVEPFAGSLALAFGLQSQSVLGGDVNPHLMNFYNQVKAGEFYIPETIRSKDTYYALRTEFNQLILDGQALSVRGAQLFWLLNHMGFNGLCRFNQDGLFNTPFGAYASRIIFPHWETYKSFFEQWTFQTQTFEALKLLDQDFVFCDPPYDHGWQGYYETHFSLDKQEKVAQWLKNHKGRGLIMNHATPQILEIYQAAGFEIQIVSAPRSISANGQKRKDVQEVIATHHFSWKELMRSV